jgi:hypothetical protein
MMNKTTLTAAIALALATASTGAMAATKKAEAAPQAAPAATQEEISAVRAQLQALADRLQKLEQSNQELARENADLKAQGEKITTAQADAEKSRDAQSDAIAKTATKVAASDWAGRIKWNGDFRYRNESIKREVRTDQVRDRIRARFGFTAKATDNLSVTMRLATGGDDPRSPNQTIGAAGTSMARRTIGLDQLYATWKPMTGTTVTLGRQPYPWFRPGQSLLNDGDVNPEGVSVNYQNGMFFGNAFGIWLSEIGANTHSLATGVDNPSAANANGASYDGLQLGVKVPFDSVTNLTAALMYSNCGGCKGHNPVWTSGYNGNTTVGAAPNALLAYQFKQTELSVELNSKLNGLPVQAFLNGAKNSGARNGQDKAWTAGFLIGKASDKNTWEVGYAYEKLEKDGYFGAFVDSDFGGGNTDVKGSVIRFGYAPAKNWTLNATYFINKLNNFSAASLTAPRDEDYKRLQLDFGVKY